jgi:hypothetical protein
MVLVLDAMPRSACCKDGHREPTLLLLTFESSTIDICM